VAFAGATFAPGVPITGLYVFNSYRVTYRYEPVRRENWMFGVGVTVKIRDAETRLDADGAGRIDAQHTAQARAAAALTEPRQVVGRPGPPDFDPAMIPIDRFRRGVRQVAEAMRFRLGEERLDVLVEARLIGLEAQHIVPSIRTLVAAKEHPDNRVLVARIVRERRSSFLDTDFIL
jgi:hypothetical protein